MLQSATQFLRDAFSWFMHLLGFPAVTPSGLFPLRYRLWALLNASIFESVCDITTSPELARRFQSDLACRRRSPHRALMLSCPYTSSTPLPWDVCQLHVFVCSRGALLAERHAALDSTGHAIIIHRIIRVPPKVRAQFYSIHQITFATTVLRLMTRLLLRIANTITRKFTPKPQSSADQLLCDLSLSLETAQVNSYSNHLVPLHSYKINDSSKSNIPATICTSTTFGPSTDRLDFTLPDELPINLAGQQTPNYSISERIAITSCRDEEDVISPQLDLTNGLIGIDEQRGLLLNRPNLELSNVIEHPLATEAVHSVASSGSLHQHFEDCQSTLDCRGRARMTTDFVDSWESDTPPLIVGDIAAYDGFQRPRIVPAIFQPGLLESCINWIAPAALPWDRETTLYASLKNEVMGLFQYISRFPNDEAPANKSDPRPDETLKQALPLYLLLENERELNAGLSDYQLDIWLGNSRGSAFSTTLEALRSDGGVSSSNGLRPFPPRSIRSTLRNLREQWTYHDMSLTDLESMFDTVYRQCAYVATSDGPYRPVCLGESQGASVFLVSAALKQLGRILSEEGVQEDSFDHLAQPSIICAFSPPTSLVEYTQIALPLRVFLYLVTHYFTILTLFVDTYAAFTPLRLVTTAGHLLCRYFIGLYRTKLQPASLSIMFQTTPSGFCSSINMALYMNRFLTKQPLGHNFLQHLQRDPIIFPMHSSPRTNHLILHYLQSHRSDLPVLKLAPQLCRVVLWYGAKDNISKLCDDTLEVQEGNLDVRIVDSFSHVDFVWGCYNSEYFIKSVWNDIKAEISNNGIVFLLDRKSFRPLVILQDTKEAINAAAQVTPSLLIAQNRSGSLTCWKIDESPSQLLWRSNRAAASFAQFVVELSQLRIWVPGEKDGSVTCIETRTGSTLANVVTEAPHNAANRQEIFEHPVLSPMNPQVLKSGLLMALKILISASEEFLLACFESYISVISIEDSKLPSQSFAYPLEIKTVTSAASLRNRVAISDDKANLAFYKYFGTELIPLGAVTNIPQRLYRIAEMTPPQGLSVQTINAMVFDPVSKNLFLALFNSLILEVRCTNDSICILKATRSGHAPVHSMTVSEEGELVTSDGCSPMVKIWKHQ